MDTFQETERNDPDIGPNAETHCPDCGTPGYESFAINESGEVICMCCCLVIETKQ